jgi:hypothetical protein
VYREPAVEVSAGETVTRDANLTPAGIAESITVRPSSDLNPRASGLETRCSVPDAVTDRGGTHNEKGFLIEADGRFEWMTCPMTDEFGLSVRRLMVWSI